MKSCLTCGMPFVGNHANQIGLELPEGPVCRFDSEKGKIKNGEIIFEGGVTFFASEVTDGDHDLAARLTRKNMRALKYWQAHPFDLLSTGEEATDEEFRVAMAGL